MAEPGDFAQAVLREADVAILLVGDDLEVRWASPAAERLFGPACGRLPGLVDMDSAGAVASFIDRVGQAGGQAVRMVCGVPVEGSSPRRVELVGRDLRSQQRVGALVLVAHDVTGWQEREEAIRQKMHTDALTGLGNRASLTERLGQAVRGAAATGLRPAVLMVDLDSFKAINDALGHHVGDVALATVGQRLASVAAAEGKVFRMGGDEFAVLLDRTSERRAMDIAGQMLARLGDPIDAGGERFTVTASIGVAMVHGDRRPETLLVQADTAMYAAKVSGSNRAIAFSPELQEWSLARKESVETLAHTVEQLRRENEALQEAASVDFRTGLSNTAAFDADHAQLHSRHQRSGEHYSVLLVDIDNFHGYNSRYRYLAGNEALRRVAETIRSSLRLGDRAYRWGGEEFAILLPGAVLDGARTVAGRIQDRVRALGIEHQGSPWGTVTVTIGGVEAGPCHESPEAVFEAANVALLEGKDSGRNTVVMARCPARDGGDCGQPPISAGFHDRS